MPLVVVSGQPASGKSAVSAALAGLLREHGIEVEVVDEPSLGCRRNSSYKDSRSEKDTRAALRSTVERRLTRERALILDSLNNIKGFRYELWCAARTVATRYCVLWCRGPDTATLRAWNAGRPPEEAYSPEIFDDLVRRFEAPDARNRWDRPLFELDPCGAEAERAQVLQGVVGAMLGRPSGPSGLAAEELRPTPATVMQPMGAAPATLGDMDSAAQGVVSAITEAQAHAGSLPIGRLSFGEGAPPLDLPQPVVLAELRRHKRAFLRLSGRAACTQAQASRMFVDYLRENLGS